LGRLCFALEETMKWLALMFCLVAQGAASAAASYEQIYVPSKGQGWSISGGLVEWNGALVSSLDSSPKGYFFNRLQRGCGVVFVLANGKFKPLYDFSSHAYERGCQIGGELSVDGEMLYGVTGEGGIRNNGTVFRLTPKGEHHLVHRFEGTDGRGPIAGLVRGADGRLYGATQFGGQHDRGTIYRIGKSGRLTTLHHFQYEDELGGYPVWGLTAGPDGAVYGVAEGGPKGGGTIFRVSTEGKVSLLKALSAADGCWPGRLTLGQDGWLYGPAFLCGQHSLGTLFRVHPSGAFERLHSFSGVDGSGPNRALTQAPDGTWYGVTAGSFEDPTSVVYRTRFDGQGVTVLHTFGTVEAGITPSGPLHFGSDGFLYGTTKAGGNDKGFLGTGPGTVFRLAP
jgi:uncharacterized repeat protein (TIGR03803 family)